MTKDLVKTHTLPERQLAARQDMREHLKWHDAFTYVKVSEWTSRFPLTIMGTWKFGLYVDT